MFTVQSLYDEFPEQEKLEEFDTFFVGEGSARVVAKVKTADYYAQVFHKPAGECNTEDLTDWEDFGGEFIKVIDYEEVFYEAKKRIFDLVGYIDKRFSESKNKMIRIKDIVVNDMDRSFIEYLKYKVEDRNTLHSIAELMAYRELGYSEARFRGKDGCPICNCMDMNVYGIQGLLDKLAQGNDIAHKYCDCSFEPFGKFYGTCDTIDGGVELINCPMEWKEYVLGRVKKLGYDFVVFGEAEKYMRKKEEKFDLGTVVFQLQNEDKVGLYIDKSFIGFYSAIDYLDRAEFEKTARTLSRSGVDYIDPKELRGDMYLMKMDDGSTAAVVGYMNPVTEKYEMRMKDTGELVSVEDF